MVTHCGVFVWKGGGMETHCGVFGWQTDAPPLPLWGGRTSTVIFSPSSSLPLILATLRRIRTAFSSFPASTNQRADSANHLRAPPTYRAA